MELTSIFHLHFLKFLCRFLDSLNHLPFPLSKLRVTFNLDNSKGYFAHLKNTKKGYEADIEEEFPEAEMFDPAFMSEAGRFDFLEWHEEQKKRGEKFHLRSSLLHYCRQDVNVLRYVY